MNSSNIVHILQLFIIYIYIYIIIIIIVLFFYFFKAAATMNQSTTPSPNSSGLRQAQSPFTLAASGRMPEERVNDCHLALTKFIVKGLHPFATVESNCFR